MLILPAFHFELIFCLLTRPKCNLSKVKKTVIQGIWNMTFDFTRLTLYFDLWLWNFKSNSTSSPAQIGTN